MLSPDEITELLYRELHALAQRRLRSERPNHTLQPTALVNETCIRLMAARPGQFQDRAHLIATAAKIMRQILIDYARNRGAAKNPAGKQRVELDALLAAAAPSVEDLLSLDEALNRFGQFAPRAARVVELRFFGGLTEDEIAAVLNVDVRTVRRDWKEARDWLQAEISRTAK